MTAGTTTILYKDVLTRLKKAGIPVPNKPRGAAKHVLVQCPVCMTDKSLTVISRMHTAELKCGAGCPQTQILTAIGFRGVQYTTPPPARQGTEEHSGQVRIAYRFAKEHAGELMHVHGLGWFWWDGRRWQPDTGGHSQRAVLATLGTALGETLGGDQTLRQDVAKCETANGIKGVLAVAAALTEFAASTDDLDADPWLLNLANGTYDLRTDELRPHDPADRITKVANGAYDPDAPGPTFYRFLNRVLPDEQVRAYLQRCAGIALLGKVVEHILPILIGSKGSNGKGSWYGAMLYALGDYAAAGEPELFTYRKGEHSTGQMDLLGRRFIVVSENDRDTQLGAAKMKRLTGGDRIKARYMHRDFVEFDPSHTAFLVTNDLPQAPGDDPAVFRRVRVIPFNVEIAEDEQDGELGDKLKAEADAIVMWAIAGWKSYRDNGNKMAAPPQVLAATHTYQRNSDDLGRFIDDECITTSPVLQATTKKLFDAWEAWRAREGAEVMSQKAFGQALDKKGYPVTSRTAGARHRAGIDLKVQVM